MASACAWRRGIGAVLALGAISLPSAASAHAPELHADGQPAHGASVPAQVQRVTGGETTALPSGLLRVETRRGADLLTHGPDPRPALATEIEPAAGGLPTGVGFSPGNEERPPVCASDYYQHVLYARPAGAPDRLAEVKPGLQAAIRRMNAVLAAASVASGGPSADYKVRCEPSGQVAVDSFVAPGSSFSEIVSAARAAGFDSARADYTIFYDGGAGGVCGIGSYADDERPTADNLNNEGGDYAIAYAPCWFNETPMHENGHNMGAVQYSAPNSTGSGGHCDEERDVMCYSPDGGDRNQGGLVGRCDSGAVHFDCNFDDYFDTAPEPGEYLAQSWNLGSTMNRFLAFGAGAGDSGAGEGPAGDTGAFQGLLGGVSPLLGRGDASGRRADTAAAPGGWRLFELRVPRRARALKVRLSGGTGAQLELYLRRGAHPTAEAFACRGGGASPQRCKLERPRRGRWYAGVLTRAGGEGAPFAIGASVRKRPRP